MRIWCMIGVRRMHKEVWVITEETKNKGVQTLYLINEYTNACYMYHIYFVIHLFWIFGYHHYFQGNI